MDISALIKYPLAMLLFSASICSADVVVIVNSQSDLTSLDATTVRRIFLGKEKLFPNTTEKIKVLDQDKNTEIYATFYKEFIGFRLKHLRRYRAANLFSGKSLPPMVKPDDSAVKAFVQAEPTAIGYIDSDLLDDTVKAVHHWSP